MNAPTKILAENAIDLGALKPISMSWSGIGHIEVTMQAENGDAMTMSMTTMDLIDWARMATETLNRNQLALFREIGLL